MTKLTPMRPEKAAILEAAIADAAAYAASHGERKPTPAKSDFFKIAQAVGVAEGYLRVPASFVPYLKTVWVASYKAAQKSAKPTASPKAKPRTYTAEQVHAMLDELLNR